MVSIPSMRAMEEGAVLQYLHSLAIYNENSHPTYESQAFFVLWHTQIHHPPQFETPTIRQA